MRPYAATSAANVHKSHYDLPGAPRGSQRASWGITGPADTEERGRNYDEGIR